MAREIKQEAAGSRISCAAGVDAQLQKSTLCINP
jgi:hypothetical protein